MKVLETLQAELAAATNRLLATAAGLSDADLSAPSRLPGWTRGHVLAHVARNADGLVNLLTWARTGVRTPQYPSTATRAAEIEVGAAHSHAEHLADLEDSSARLAAAIRDLPEEAWSAAVEAMRPPPHPAWYVLVRRLREIELHHVDLGAGYGPGDWPAVFVHRELHDCLACWPYATSPVSEIGVLDGEDRIAWTGLGGALAVEGAAADVLAWLTGRSRGEGIRVVPEGRHAVPAPPPWLTMPAPPDLPSTPPEDYP